MLQRSSIGQTGQNLWRKIFVPGLLWLAQGVVRAVIILLSLGAGLALLYQYAWQPFQQSPGLLPELTSEPALADKTQQLEEIESLTRDRLGNGGSSFTAFGIHFVLPAREGEEAVP